MEGFPLVEVLVGNVTEAFEITVPQELNTKGYICTCRLSPRGTMITNEHRDKRLAECLGRQSNEALGTALTLLMNEKFK